MQICKKIILFFWIIFSSVFALTAQISQPTSPSMPYVSAPTIGKTFYTPGVNSSYPVTQDSTTQTTAENTSTDKKTDFINLAKNGLLNSLNLNQDNLETSLYTQDNSMLSQISKSIEELKSTNTKVSFPPETDEPKILRFNINGKSILDTLKTVYFSKKESDGTFLISADRKYYADGKTRNETFYLLFKADGNCGANKGYDVKPALTQDYKNTNSFIYKLSQQLNLKAHKTGNLVTMRSVSENFIIDLLLDIGK